MAKTKISEFSTTAGNNTDINSINIAEGCAPSGINDAIRELMRQLKEFQTGGAGDSVNSGGDFSVATNKFTVASATGNTAVAGTLGATGDFAVNTNKFTVAASSGNTAVAGTFAVTGATTLTGALVANGNSTLGDADTDTVTLNASFVTGTTLKTAKSDTNTLALAAYDVDGTAYTNLVTLTAGNTPSLALTSTAVGTINNMSIGATTASTGAFTTLSASSSVTLSGGTANGVLYLNGSKVATSGSALVFDGNSLGVGVNPNTTIWSGDETRLVVKGTGSSYAGTFAVQSKGTNNAVTGYFIANDLINTVVLGSKTNTPVVFNTNDTEAMRLTSTGLGIGTSSPGAKLHAVTSSGYPFAAVGQYNALRTSSQSDRFILSGTDTTLAASYQPLQIQGSTLYFAIGATTSATLDSSGRLGIGTTTTSNARVTSLGVSNNYPAFRAETDATTSQQQISFVNPNGVVGTITTSGSATAFNTSSDQRLKENIANAEDAGSLVDALQVRQFDWKADGSHQRYGFVAQELLSVAPEAVHQPIDPDEMMAVDYSKLVPMLVKEIQSLRARVAALES